MWNSLACHTAYSPWPLQTWRCYFFSRQYANVLSILRRYDRSSWPQAQPVGQENESTEWLISFDQSPSSQNPSSRSSISTEKGMGANMYPMYVCMSVCIIFMKLSGPLVTETVRSQRVPCQKSYGLHTDGDKTKIGVTDIEHLNDHFSRICFTPSSLVIALLSVLNAMSSHGISLFLKLSWEPLSYLQNYVSLFKKWISFTFLSTSWCFS